MYKWGDGVIKSTECAKEWYTLSLNNGYYDAKEELDLLTGKTVKEEVVTSNDFLTDNFKKAMSASTPVNNVACPICNSKISPYANACPQCGEPMAKRCPKCRSTNIARLTGVDKGLGVALFGAFAANTVLSDYQCRDCKEKFT